MVTTPWESDLTKALADEFGDRIVEFCNYLGQNFLIAKGGAHYQIIESLKMKHGFDYLVDVTAVHYPNKPEQFELIYILYSFSGMNGSGSRRGSRMARGRQRCSRCI